MKIMFVVNPISGGVDKEPFLKSATAFCKKYGIDYHIFKTTGKNDDQEMKKELLEYDPDKVASVGGDGTTLFTATNLMGTDYPMGIIPLGSANGMATELYVAPNPMDAFRDLVLSDVIHGLDLVLVNDKYYTLHIGDVGLNAQIVDSHDKSSKRGMGIYAKYFVEKVSKAKPFKMKIRIGGDTFQKEGLMVALCNARKYGTGVPLTLNGNPMDGVFEIVVIERIDVKSLIKAGLSKFDEQYFDHQDGTIYQTNDAEIWFEEPRLLQLDGEVIGEFDHIKAQVLPRAVRLITHKDNKYLNQH